MTPGQLAYEAYSEAVGGKSVTGKPLPTWDGQKAEIAAAWEKAAEAVRAGMAAEHPLDAGGRLRSHVIPLGGDEAGRDRVTPILIPPNTPQPL